MSAKGSDSETEQKSSIISLGAKGEETSANNIDENGFRLTNLQYPKDVEHQKILDLLQAAHRFDMSFERPENGVAKVGRLNVAFGTVNQAQLMFGTLKDLLDVDLKHVVVERPKHWDDVVDREESAIGTAECPDTFLMEDGEVVEQTDHVEDSTGAAAGLVGSTVEENVCASEEAEPGECDSPTPSDVPDFVTDDPDAPLKLYISNLLPSSDQELMVAIFGKEKLKKVTVCEDDSRTDGSKIAVLTFYEKQQADLAKAEFNGFSIDDGDVSRAMRIVSFSKHLENVYNETKKRLEAERTRKAGNLWAEQLTAPTRAVEPVEMLSFSNRKGRAVASTGPAGLELMGAAIVPPIMPERIWTPAEIQYEITWLLQQSGVKYEDFNGATDIWVLLDQVAVRNENAVGEKDLAKTMMSLLEKEKFQPGVPGWRRQHIDFLHNEWRRETQGLDNPQWKRHSRPTINLKKTEERRPQVDSAQGEPDYAVGPTKWEDVSVIVIPSGPDNYTPVPEEPKRRRGRRTRKEVIGLMGVGSLLSGLAAEAAVEPGEIPITEDPRPTSKVKGSSEQYDSRKYANQWRGDRQQQDFPVDQQHLGSHEYEADEFATHEAAGHRGRENRAKRRRRRRSRSSGSSDVSSSSEERRRRHERRKRRELQGPGGIDSTVAPHISLGHQVHPQGPIAPSAANPLTNMVSAMPNLMNMMPLLGMMGGGGGALPQLLLVVQQMQRMLAMMPPGQQQQLMQQMATQLQSMLQPQSQPPQGHPQSNPVVLQMQQIMQQLQSQLGPAQPGVPQNPNAQQPQPVNPMMQIQQLMAQLTQPQQNNMPPAGPANQPPNQRLYGGYRPPM